MLTPTNGTNVATLCADRKCLRFIQVISLKVCAVIIMPVSSLYRDVSFHEKYYINLYVLNKLLNVTFVHNCVYYLHVVVPSWFVFKNKIIRSNKSTCTFLHSVLFSGFETKKNNTSDEKVTHRISIQIK